MPTSILPTAKPIDGSFCYVTLKGIFVQDDGTIAILLSSALPSGSVLPPFDDEPFTPPDALKRETLALVLFAMGAGITVMSAWLQPAQPGGKIAALRIDPPTR